MDSSDDPGAHSLDGQQLHEDAVPGPAVDDVRSLDALSHAANTAFHLHCGCRWTRSSAKALRGIEITTTETFLPYRHAEICPRLTLGIMPPAMIPCSTNVLQPLMSS